MALPDYMRAPLTYYARATSTYDIDATFADDVRSTLTDDVCAPATDFTDARARIVVPNSEWLRTIKRGSTFAPLTCGPAVIIN